MQKPILTLEQSRVSPHRQHVITHEDEVELNTYFYELDQLNEWDPEELYEFEGLTIEQAGRKYGDYQKEFDYSEEWIQHMICHLFNYEGEY